MKDRVEPLLFCNDRLCNQSLAPPRSAVSSRNGSVGKSKVVPTSAFGVSVNYAYVGIVLHVDEPDSMIDYAQESRWVRRRPL
jgi:hypothetical protein